MNGAEPSTRWGWKEKIIASYGIVVLFFIIAIPRLGGTILSYFTQEVVIFPKQKYEHDLSSAVLAHLYMRYWADKPNE